MQGYIVTANELNLAQISFYLLSIMKPNPFPANVLIALGDRILPHLTTSSEINQHKSDRTLNKSRGAVSMTQQPDLT